MDCFLLRTWREGEESVSSSATRILSEERKRLSFDCPFSSCCKGRNRIIHVMSTLADVYTIQYHICGIYRACNIVLVTTDCFAMHVILSPGYCRLLNGQANY